MRSIVELSLLGRLPYLGFTASKVRAYLKLFFKVSTQWKERKMPMTGLEPGICGVGSDHSANSATTTDPSDLLPPDKHL